MMSSSCRSVDRLLIPVFQPLCVRFFDAVGRSLFFSLVLLTSVTFCFRSESLSAESRSVQSSPSYRLMKSRSESDLSQPESDEEGYTLVERTHINSLYCLQKCVLRAASRGRTVVSWLFFFSFQSGRRNVDLDLAFSHKKRGNDRLQKAPADDASQVFLCVVISSHVLLLSPVCLSIPLWIVYLLLLGQLSPKHKRSSKQVNDGMFLPLVSSSLHDLNDPVPIRLS